MPPTYRYDVWLAIGATLKTTQMTHMGVVSHDYGPYYALRKFLNEMEHEEARFNGKGRTIILINMDTNPHQPYIFTVDFGYEIRS